MSIPVQVGGQDKNLEIERIEVRYPYLREQSYTTQCVWP
jgi:hypothetical protein